MAKQQDKRVSLDFWNRKFPEARKNYTKSSKCAELYTVFAIIVRYLSRVQVFYTPRTAGCQVYLSFTVSQSLLKFRSVESTMLSISSSVAPSPPALELSRIWWTKYWSFSCSISPSNDYSGLISFRIDWFDLLAVLATLKSLLQHHNSKASILWRSAFFSSNWSNSYTQTRLLEKPYLTISSFAGKVMSLLFNMLSRFLIAFLSRSKRLLIWLQLSSA